VAYQPRTNPTGTTALGVAYRDDALMPPSQRLRLLKAIEGHSALVDGLLSRVEQD